MTCPLQSSAIERTTLDFDFDCWRLFIVWSRNKRLAFYTITFCFTEVLLKNDRRTEEEPGFHTTIEEGPNERLERKNDNDREQERIQH